MKIVFLQHLWYEWQAPMILSAIAKQKGHTAELYIEPNPITAALRVVERGADLVAFASVVTGNMDYVYACAKQIKEIAEIPIVAGGPHISLFYKNLSLEFIDYMEVGEGELSFAGLLDVLENKASIYNVPGLYYADKGSYRINQPKTIANLDTIPVVDRDLYYSYGVFRNEKVRLFYSGRGCKYSCKHCCVPLLSQLNCQPQVRRRAPDSLVDEILQIKQRYGLKAAFFQDDTFTQDPLWLEDFLPLYRDKIGKPLMCMSRAADITSRTAELLKAAGCVSVGIGIETSNEKTRMTVLGREEGNQYISEAISLLKNNGIKVTTFNMIGIPSETMQDVIDTIRFNHENRVDSPWGVLYQPYIGKGKALSQNSYFGNFYSKLGYDHPESAHMEKVQKLLPLLVKGPRFINILIKVIPAPAAYLLFAAYSFLRDVRIWRRSFFITLWVGIKNQLVYRKNYGQKG